MTDYVQTWRKKLRIKELVDFAQKEIKSGKDKEDIYKILDTEMKVKWNLVLTTRRQYIADINKILTGHSVLGA